MSAYISTSALCWHAARRNVERPTITLRRARCGTVPRTRFAVIAAAPQVGYNQAPQASPSADTHAAALRTNGSSVRQILDGVRQLAQPLYGGERRLTAWLWTAATVLLALAATLYAVMLSMIQRFFWNSLNARDASKFGKLLLLYGVAVLIGPVVISTFNWIRQRLALMWRNTLTEHLLRNYFAQRSYYKLSVARSHIDNPDQRLSEDVMQFTSRAVRFITVLGVGAFDLLVFSVLLYRVYKPLLFLLIVYCALGTALIARAGRRLLLLNRQQASTEADLRFALVRVRDNTESIAFYGGERAEHAELRARFARVFDNKRALLALSRTVELLSSSFRYWAQLAPTALIAPQYFAGKLPLGALSQVYFSFNHVLSSLGLVVSEFSALAEFGAGVRRLQQLSHALARADDGHHYDVVDDDDDDHHHDDDDDDDEHAAAAAALTLRGVSVLTPSTPARTLLRCVSLSVGHGQRLLVVGRSGIGKSSLLRAMCGLWPHGDGSISRPARAHTLFLPQRAFVMLGSLRDNVLYPRRRAKVADSEVEAALRRVNLGYLLQQVGLHASGEELSRRLSVGEQQRLAFARVVMSKPRFVVLDESTSALDLDNERDMYALVAELGATCVSVGNRPSLLQFHHKVLRIEEGGHCRVWDAAQYAAAQLRESGAGHDAQHGAHSDEW